MKNRTKQIITGITANILFLPPIYFALINDETKTNWKIICLSLLPLIMVLVGFRLYWGPNAFKKSAWEEKGFSNFHEWFKKSQTFNGRFFRFIIKFFLPLFVAITIIAVITIKILE